MNPADEPLISVITPAYNCEKYLERCVNSVRSQGFTDWEMIIVEDGSMDSTLEVASRHATTQALQPMQRLTSISNPRASAGARIAP